MATFHYVYIMTSCHYPARRYTGRTSNLRRRFRAHNSGQVRHTSKFKPWRIEIAVAFRDSTKAVEFERYMKSHSGRAFAKKHF